MNEEIESQTAKLFDGTTHETSSTGDLTPIQLTTLTALAIFVGEALIMFVMPFFGGLHVTYQAIIDAVLLTLLTAPVLSFLLFRPMVQHIKERKNAERTLQELNHTLEHRVTERTRELENSDGETVLFKLGVVVVSRTPLGEPDEVLVVATPVDDCA
jgi:Na+(H+)/acetate symporter ActP